MGNNQSSIKPKPTSIVQGIHVDQGTKIDVKPKIDIKPKIDVKPKIDIKPKIEIYEDLNNIYYLKNMFKGAIDKYLENSTYLINNYKIYLSRTRFERIWKGKTEDGYLELPCVNVLSNVRFENINDIDLIESVTISYNVNQPLEQIPTCIFKQLQDFYKMERNCIPYFLFKYGLPIHYQSCKLRFKYKPNVDNKEISIIVNVNQNLNNFKENINVPVYYIKEEEIKNDNRLNLYTPSYFFIPRKKNG